MRFLLIALMIALLPLRGWAGHVMAVDMAAQQIAVAHAEQRSSMKASGSKSAAMPADCLMFGKASPGNVASLGTDTPVTSGLQCNSCDTCELCLALASFAHAEWPSGKVGMHSAPVAFGIGFSSADRASSFKPPIS